LGTIVKTKKKRGLNLAHRKKDKTFEGNATGKARKVWESFKKTKKLQGVRPQGGKMKKT